MSERTPESEQLFRDLIISNQKIIAKLISIQEQQMIYIDSYFFVSKNSIEQQKESQPTYYQPIPQEDKTIRDQNSIN